MYLSLYCKGSKRVTQGFTVRRSWRPNWTAIYWPPLLWLSALCLSRSPGLLKRRPRGPALCWMMAFFTTSYHQLVFETTRGLEGPFIREWLSLPHLISNLSGPQLSQGPRGPLRPGVAFSTTSCLRRLWSPTQSGAPRAPSAWCGFPYHISSLLQLISTFLSWPSYIIVPRPLNLWNGMFDRHQAEITVMHFRGHSLPVY